MVFLIADWELQEISLSVCAFYCAALREMQGHVSKINLFNS